MTLWLTRKCRGPTHNKSGHESDELLVLDPFGGMRFAAASHLNEYNADDGNAQSAPLHVGEDPTEEQHGEQGGGQNAKLISDLWAIN